MRNIFKGENNKALVAVSETVKESDLANYESLANLTGMKLRFTHVCDSEINGSIYLAHSYWEANSYQLLYSLRKLKEDNAKQLLNKNLQPLAQKMDFEKNIMAGDIATNLLADAQVNRASMIVCSAQHESYKYLMKGFSTSLQLMSEANIPVLVLPNGIDEVFFKKGLTIIIADDLEKSSLSSVIYGSELAAAIGEAKIYHVYVTKEENDLKDYVRKLREAMNLSQITFDPNLSEDAIIARYESSLKNKMQERKQSVSSVLKEANCSYESKILTGSVDEKLIELVHKINADLVVFGRHVAVHRKPFGIGQVPFRTMMSIKKPVMLVPPEFGK